MLIFAEAKKEYEVKSDCFSVAKSCLDSLRPHILQHVTLPCPSLSLGVCSDSCPLSQGSYLTILSSVALVSFCLQSFPASALFQ